MFINNKLATWIEKSKTERYNSACFHNKFTQICLLPHSEIVYIMCDKQLNRSTQ